MAKADPSREILDGIRSIVRALRVSSRSTEKSCGLSTAQLFVLRSLEGSEGLSVKELAARTLTHQSSVSAVVKRLVEKELVSREPSPRDSRSVVLTLTRTGKAKLRRSPPLIQERMISTLAKFPDPDRREFARLLRRFVEKSGLDEGVPPLFLEEKP